MAPRDQPRGEARGRDDARRPGGRGAREDRGEREARERVRALLAELDAVYADAARLYEGAACDASTECCRFAVTRREPYVTSIELAALERAVASRGGPSSWRPADGAARRAPTQGKRSLPVARADGVCPLLTDQGRCAVYAARPLGCRTFFCDRATLPNAAPHERVRELVGRVKAIGQRHEPGGELGRPLRSALK